MLIAFYKDIPLDVTLTIISDKIFIFQILQLFAFALSKTLLVIKYDCKFYLSEGSGRKSRN
jgi:hypothetical protein